MKTDAIGRHESVVRKRFQSCLRSCGAARHIDRVRDEIHIHRFLQAKESSQRVLEKTHCEIIDNGRFVSLIASLPKAIPSLN